ncbi:SurA N-terminal domain-containing protein [Elioraea rosea]|uniref:SurA N-terminal domain-containing protein n=1 Tax=Elioraea rosea TaxID=2492390 RepID=UPI0013158EB4|nr:peptidyl-prolyl cis-trans isomerase [Elioraea rosea]
MLSAMRGWLESWVAKALFLLLILSFAVWGIGDFVQGGSVPTTVATVAGRDIPLDEANEAYRRELLQLQRSFGGNFEPTAPLRRRVAEDVVNRLAALTAISEEARGLGLVVTDEQLRQAVFAAPPFQGLDGRFSRVAFEGFLRNAGLSEARFLELLRGDLLRQQLLSAVRAGAVAPEAIAGPVYAFQGEAREAQVVEMPFIAAAAPPEPTEEQLRRLHENDAARFTAPEYRRFSLLALTLEDVARDITPTEEQLRAAYESRAAEFNQPEKRVIEQILVPEEGAARALAEAWRGGLDFATISARATEANGTAVELGSLAAADLPDQALAAAAFGAAEGAVAEPLQTAFGWHVLRIVSVEPAATRSFAEVRDTLARDVARELAAERIYTIANRVEDSLAEGISLAEAGRRHALQVREVPAMDGSGFAPDGTRVNLSPGGTQVVDTVFSTQPGTTSRLVEAEGANFFAIRLDSVTPPALKPFETVRDEVKAAWENAERRRSMEAQAAQMLAAVQGGTAFDAAAAAQGWTARRIGPFLRSARGAGAPQAPVLQALFGLKRGEATMVELPNAFVVIGLAGITEPQREAERFAALRAAMATGIGDDIEAQFAQAIQSRAAATINQRGIDLLVGTDP